MAFRATNVEAATAYDKVRRNAAQLKRLASFRATEFSTGADANQILAVLDNLNAFKAAIDGVKNTPGLTEYARTVENDPAYDPVAEAQIMLTLVDAAIATIIGGIPTSLGGFAELFTPQNGGFTPRLFTKSQLSTVVTDLQAIDAAIS